MPRSPLFPYAPPNGVARALGACLIAPRAASRAFVPLLCAALLAPAPMASAAKGEDKRVARAPAQGNVAEPANATSNASSNAARKAKGKNARDGSEGAGGSGEAGEGAAATASGDATRPSSDKARAAAAAASVDSEVNVTGDNLQGQTPRMEFSRLRHSFETLSRGEKVSHAFPFTNTGKGTLQVRSIHASCGCVNTRVEPKDTFAPGESGRVVFEFDSSLFVGAVVRTITVDTNAQNPSTQTLTFTADVKPEVLVRPNVVTMGEIPKEYEGGFDIEVDFADRAGGETGTHVRDSVNRSALPDALKAQALAGQGPVRIVQAATSSPALVASVVEADERKAKVRVTVRGPLPIGPFRERLTLWNNSRHMKETVVAVTGEVVGHVKTSAKYLEFGVVTGPSSVRRSLKLESDLADFKVSAVEVDLRRSEALKGVRAADIMAFQTERTKEGVVVHFDMRVPPGLEADVRNVNASGAFIVRTSDPDYREIRVPFFGVLRRK